ncbi:MAG: hypothetical protein AB8B71_10920 [Paracoccaceae bacterium]
MVCTEERNMTMANGKKFSTGNRPVKLGLPILHLMNAGFEIDIVTPTGAPVEIDCCHALFRGLVPITWQGISIGNIPRRT